MGVRSQGQNLAGVYKNASPITWQELGNWDSVGNGSTSGETDT